MNNINKHTGLVERPSEYFASAPPPLLLPLCASKPGLISLYLSSVLYPVDVRRPAPSEFEVEGGDKIVVDLEERP
jgi:hypothetical protein